MIQYMTNLLKKLVANWLYLIISIASILLLAFSCSLWITIAGAILGIVGVIIGIKHSGLEWGEFD